MKIKNLKLKIVFICLLLFSSLLFPLANVSADTKPTLSLSDAVLADLALHNYLDYVSIDFKDKKSPNTITINQDKQWLPASTVKLFVAMYAADQINKKNITLDQWVTIDAKNVVPTELETNDYPTLTADLIVTVDTLLREMITQSDNTAYNTLLDLLDRQQVTNYAQGLGLTHTIIGSKLNLDDSQTQYEYTTPGYNINTTTAADYAKAYDMIDNRKIPGSALLFDILKQQKIQNMIPALLPVKELTIAHKPGDLDPLYHDGGIIVGNNKHYILTIFTNLGNPNILAHLSQLIFTKNYQLVGAKIPEKDTTPTSPQALDPLVMNPSAYRAVLAATTIPVNVPIPQITAADLGIGPNELSLVIPDDKLPKSVISPTSPFHVLIPAWYGLQSAFAIGQKNRQQVALNYSQQLLSDAKTLQKSGQTQLATNYINNVQHILNTVASDHVVKPDTQTQIQIQAISQTQFATMQSQVQQTSNDDARIALLQQVANQAKQTLTTIAPNIPQAKAAASPNQQPLVGHVIDATPGHVIIETPNGQQVHVNVSNDTKITSQNVLPTPSTTPSPSEETPSPSGTPTPTVSPSPIAPTLQKGASVALVGSINGDIFTPSVVVTNIHKELEAPQPVTVVKVNTKNNTMVVDDNGTPIQVDLSSQTTIKGKDTNVPLQAIQPGSVVVVHGTDVQQVSSDTKSSATPTVVPTSSTANPTARPSTGTQSGPTTKPSQAISPTGSGGISTTPGKPSLSPAQGKSTGITSAPTSTKQVVPTSAPKSRAATPTTAAPVVIQATSVQVVQQKPTNAPVQAAPQSQPATKPKSQPPAQQPAAQPPAQSAVSQQKSTSTPGKK